MILETAPVLSDLKEDAFVQTTTISAILVALSARLALILYISPSASVISLYEEVLYPINEIFTVYGPPDLIPCNENCPFEFETVTYFVPVGTCVAVTVAHGSNKLSFPTTLPLSPEVVTWANNITLMSKEASKSVNFLIFIN